MKITRPIRYWCTLIPVVTALVLAGCSGAGKKDTDLSTRPIRVVATVGMIADAVQQIGGERVAVTGLMGPGVDPHLYKASAGDVGLMTEADLIFYGGLHLEGAMAELFEQMATRTRTVAIAEGIEEARLLTVEGGSGTHDPHIWFDVALWKDALTSVPRALIEMDSGHAEVYRTNAERYFGELDSLDSYVRAQAARVPEQQRVVITAHDAFHYFGRAYGFEVIGLQGISTAAEAGTADIQSLASLIVERRIAAMFVESSVPRRNIEAVQAAVQAKGFEVRIGGELFSDAMGDAGSPEGTYLGMVRHNIDTIVEALLRP